MKEVSFEDYRVLEEIGRGGMTTVYRAIQISLEREVALKVIHDYPADDSNFVGRFKREALIAASLDHPNIVKIYDVKEEGGKLFISMEFLRGSSLRDVIIHRRPMQEDLAMRIVTGIAQALDYAHSHGVIHRDINPSNVMLVPTVNITRVVVMDFGIVNAYDREHLTMTGASIGTPAYMAPEQIMELIIDHRADIYALGIVLYYMLCGEVPFQGETPSALHHKLAYDTPPPLSSKRLDVSKWLEMIVMKAMEKDPQNRYQSANELINDLQQGIRRGGIFKFERLLQKEQEPIPCCRESRLRWGSILGAMWGSIWDSLGEFFRKKSPELTSPCAMSHIPDRDSIGTSGSHTVSGILSFPPTLGTTQPPAYGTTDPQDYLIHHLTNCEGTIQPFAYGTIDQEGTIIKPKIESAVTKPSHLDDSTIPVSALKAEVQVISGPDTKKTYPIIGKETRFGRASMDGGRKNDIVFSDKTVSRDHAKVIYNDSDKTYTLINESSNNPTKVNDKAEPSIVLNDGDEIEFGTTRLRFYVKGAGRSHSKYRPGTPEMPVKVVDLVHFTLTSPPVVQPGDLFLVDVWAHLEKQRKKVLLRALATSRKKIQIKGKGPFEIPRGAKLSVLLRIEDLIIEDPEDCILWAGEVGNAAFPVKVPMVVKKGPKSGLALIYLNGLQIAKVYFVIKVGKNRVEPQELSIKEQRNFKAFASYSKKDFNIVLDRVQNLQKAAPQITIFTDVYALRKDQRWREDLRKVIPANDIFYLFWSENAKESYWVEKEWQCALQTKKPDFIDLMQLSQLKKAPLPTALSYISKHIEDGNGDLEPQKDPSNPDQGCSKFPIRNPYVAGNPVTDSSFFFGRGDVFEFIQQKITQADSKNTVVIYGGRRTGKTSLLCQIMKGSLGEGFLPVYIDLQEMADVDTHEFFEVLYGKIALTLDHKEITIEHEDFTRKGGNPYRKFDHFIDNVEGFFKKDADEKYLLLMLDEYEMIDAKVKRGNLPEELFTYFRSMIQNRSHIYFLFTGTRQLEMLEGSHWSLMFNQAVYRKISFIEAKDARNLIEIPLRGQVEYDPDSVDAILRLTSGHPYFTQLICLSIVDILNQNRATKVTEKELKDAIHIISHHPVPHLIYFWNERSWHERLALASLAEILSHSDSWTSVPELEKLFVEEGFPFNADKMKAALNECVMEEFLERSGKDDYRYRIDLLRYWIKNEHPFWKVIEDMKSQN
ncbi:MAG: protein kinase [Vulcanimicrobiota bacterium]